MPGGHREVGDEVFRVRSDGVVRGRVLHTGVEHTGVVERIVGKELTEARKSELILQLFSFVNQTLHLGYNKNS